MHQPWEDLIPFYVNQTLPPADARALEQHLIGCMLCQKSLENWRTIASATWEEADSLTRELPPLSTKIFAEPQEQMRSLNGAQGGHATRVITFRDSTPPRQFRNLQHQRRSSYPVTALAAAAVAVLVFGGFVLSFLSHRSDVAEQIQQLTPVAMSSQSATQSNLSAPADSSPESRQTDLGIIRTTATNTIMPSPTQAITATFLSPPPSQESNTSLAVPATADNDNVPECYTTSNNGQPVNIYEWPGREYAVKGVLDADEIPRTLVTSGTGWYEIVSGVTGIWGWVSGEDVMLQGPRCDNLWIPTPTMDAIETSAGCYAIAITGTSVNIRTGPGMDYPMINAFGPNDLVEVSALSNNGWYRITMYVGGTAWNGWATTDQVSLSGSCDRIEQVTADGYPSEATPVLYTPTPIPTLPAEIIVGGNWTHTSTTLENGCGGIIGETTNISLTLYPGSDYSSVGISYSGGASFTVFRTGQNVYYGTYGSAPQVTVEMRFQSPTSYTATETITHESGCIIKSQWTGQLN